MRVGPDLARWLGDRERRAASRRRLAGFAAHWAEATPLAALARALDALAAPDATAVSALVRPLLEAPGWACDLIDRLIGEVRRDPFFEPPLTPVASGIESGLQLYAGRHAAIAIGVGALDRLAARKRAGGGEGAIAFTGHMMMLRAIKAGGARLSLWEGGWRGDAILPVCRPVGDHELADGELLAVDGRTTSFLVEHARSDMVMLHATILAESAPTSCEYDGATRALIATGAASDGASRTQLLTSLLGALGRGDADAFGAASRAAEPFVRWHALREWLSVDMDAAAGRLHEMAAADPDAELRGLAGRTLALIEARRCRA
ncbi:MAG TPA: hypothetical protein VGC10_10735 [Sphingomonas sp.]